MTGILPTQVRCEVGASIIAFWAKLNGAGVAAMDKLQDGPSSDERAFSISLLPRGWLFPSGLQHSQHRKEYLNYLLTWTSPLRISKRTISA